MSNLTVNSWDEFQPLRTVMVGSVFEDSFLDGIKNTTIKNGLAKILRETREDIEYFKQTLISHGIDVIQLTPKELGYQDSILDYTDWQTGEMGVSSPIKDFPEASNFGVNHRNIRLSRDSSTGIPQPPLAIRDDALVMGDKILITQAHVYSTNLSAIKYKEMFGDAVVDNSIYEKNINFRRSIKNVKSWAERHHLSIDVEDIEELEKLQDSTPLNGWCAPNLTRLGSKVLVDVWQTPEVVEEFLEPNYKNFDFHKIFIGGHNDSVFSVVRPGLVIATPWFKPYADIFKGWDIIWFDQPSWGKEVKSAINLRHNNQGCYWTPEVEENPQLEKFINDWLDNWHGQVDETIFDVNVLVLDDKHVVINSNDKNLINQLEQRGITPIYVPLRHRFFWDGGWHCNTLDIHRSGIQADYML